MTENGPLQFIDAVFCQISMSKNLLLQRTIAVYFQTF